MAILLIVLSYQASSGFDLLLWLSGGLLQGLNEDSLAVADGIGEKVGVFLQHSSTVICGYIVAFTYGWDMTLVLLGVLPFLAGCGYIMAQVTTSFAKKSQQAYTEVGALMSGCPLYKALIQSN